MGGGGGGGRGTVEGTGNVEAERDASMGTRETINDHHGEVRSQY